MAARKCRACKTKLELYYRDKKSRIFLCGTCRVLLIPRERGYLPIKHLPPLKEKKTEMPRGHNGCPVIIREWEACKGWQNEADRQKYGCAECPSILEAAT
ncbi:MAG: hypothetical protein ABH874_08290 [Methanobacteriota archaeon]